MNSRKEQASKTKNKLIDAALSIIRQHGFQELSANKIAEVAGVSKGGIFHHFSQIEDLYLCILDSTIEQFSEDLDPSGYKSLGDYIDFVSDYMMKFLDANPERVIALYYFISQSQHNSEYQKRLEIMMEDSLESWGEKVSFFFKTPLTKADRDFLIRILDIYFGGFSTHYLIFKDKRRYRKVSKDFGRLITSYLEERSQK
ncbi:MAG: TetR/AcrR family transcriptional regulator [Pseudomonadales bacterium]|nr:TetR/AcrR family transcriptional regulator [Pseudomonadales bacterium]